MSTTKDVRKSSSNESYEPLVLPSLQSLIAESTLITLQPKPKIRSVPNALPIKLSDWSKQDHLEYWSQRCSFPKSKKDWMRLMIENVKKKIHIEVLSDTDLAGAITRAKKVLCKEKKPKSENIDPDLPECYYWNAEQVGDWIDNLGFPDVQNMFITNHIHGRRLIEVDADALRKMGLTDITRIRQVTKHIRTLLDIPAPNALRAIIRLVPFELYLHAKARTGAESDALSFKTFCNKNGFPYDTIMETKNKCNLKPPVCTSRVPIPMSTHNELGLNVDLDQVDSDDRSSAIREEVMKEVFDKIILLVVNHTFPANGKLQIDISLGDMEHPIRDRVHEIYNQAFFSLGLSLNNEQADFIASVANELVNDVLKTREIMEDLHEFSNYLQNNRRLDPTLLEEARIAGVQLLQKVLPVAALLSLNQLDLNVIKRIAPQLLQFVENIVDKLGEYGAADASKNFEDGDNIVDFLSNSKLNRGNEK